MSNWLGQRILIIGAARQGTALARYLVEHGAKVMLTDQQPLEKFRSAQAELADLGEAIQWSCGGHPLSLLDQVDLVCPSGGVPLDIPILVEARQRGIMLSNDSQIFLEASPCPVIGITGSAGKTTTTTLVGRMAAAATRGNSSKYRQAFVGGNIGTPLISSVNRMTTSDLAVMELSSFQLEIMTRSPQIGAILNITPNHLDRHGNMQAYSAAKAHILDFQKPTDCAILGRDDPGAWGLAPRVHGRLFSFGYQAPPAGQSGTFVRQDALYMQDGQSEHYLMPRSSIQLRGEHNLLNVLAACAISAAVGLPVEAMRAGVVGFNGVPHRLEFVRRYHEADWYNDSKATTPDHTMAAIRAFNVTETEKHPIILLVGGRDKHLPWDDFVKLAQERVDHIILFGEMAELVESTLNKSEPQHFTVRRVKSLKAAVHAAVEVIEPGAIVLLSPGGTSFDEFRDFEARGEAYRLWVHELS